MGVYFCAGSFPQLLPSLWEHCSLGRGGVAQHQAGKELLGRGVMQPQPGCRSFTGARGAQDWWEQARGSFTGRGEAAEQLRRQM